MYLCCFVLFYVIKDKKKKKKIKSKTLKQLDFFWTGFIVKLPNFYKLKLENAVVLG